MLLLRQLHGVAWYLTIAATAVVSLQLGVQNGAFASLNARTSAHLKSAYRPLDEFSQYRTQSCTFPFIKYMVQANLSHKIAIRLSGYSLAINGAMEPEGLVVRVF